MNPSLQEAVETCIAKATGTAVQTVRVSALSGGCINETNLVETNTNQKFVVKHNDAIRGMFAAEIIGLQEIARTSTIRVPKVVGSGAAGNTEFVVLEHIETLTPTSKSFFETFGRSLARLHQESTSARFGLGADNLIGTNTQQNTWEHSWPTFWIESRLLPQIRLASRNGFNLSPSSDRHLRWLESNLSQNPIPSLIHGDLWSGNFLQSSDNEPVLIDPAIYYGDHEAEFGMTTLFGGFPPEFYEAYNEVFPLDPNWRERVEIYQLYHLLNHLNLFGSSYLPDCLKIFKKFS